MSLDFPDLTDLEQRITSASGPRYRSQTALKLDVMRAVRNQQQRQRARRQFASTASLIMVCLLVCGLSFQWSVASVTVSASPDLFADIPTSLTVEETEIGSWGHVDAVLAHQSRIAQSLSM